MQSTRPLRSALLVVVALVLALVAYGPSIRGGAVWDDHLLLSENPTIAGDTPPAAAFGQPFTPFPLYYRPLTALVIRAGVDSDPRVGNPASRNDAPAQREVAATEREEASSEGQETARERPVPSLLRLHLISILLHSFVACGILGLARWTGAGPRSAGFAALLFLLHPAFTESVAWTSALGDLLAAAALVGASLLLLGAPAIASSRAQPGPPPLRRTGPRRAALHAAGATLLVAVAFFAKETALLVPPVLFAASFLGTRATRPMVRGSKSHAPAAPRSARVSAPALASLLAACGFAAAGGLYAALRSAAVPPGFGLGSDPDPTRAFVVLGHAFRKVVLPTDLDLHPILDRPAGLDSNLLWAGAAALGLALAFRVAARRPRAFFGLGWFGATALPAWILVPPSSPVFAERYLYLPCVGLAMAIPALLGNGRGLPGLWPGTAEGGSRRSLEHRGARAFRAAGWTAATAVLLAAFLHTRSRSSDWGAEERLLNRSLQRDARNLPVAVNRGFLLRASGRSAEALQVYERTVTAIDEGRSFYWTEHDSISWVRLLFESGNLASDAGRPAEAEVYLRRALAVDPAHAGALGSLSAVLGNSGRLDEVVALLQPAIAADPGSVLLRANLALALELLGRKDEARAQYGAILALEPGHPVARAKLDATP